jgi:hypothetical protein
MLYFKVEMHFLFNLAITKFAKGGLKTKRNFDMLHVDIVILLAHGSFFQQEVRG